MAITPGLHDAIRYGGATAMSIPSPASIAKNACRTVNPRGPYAGLLYQKRWFAEAIKKRMG
jgi:hypothetical protein